MMSNVCKQMNLLKYTQLASFLSCKGLSLQTKRGNFPLCFIITALKDATLMHIFPCHNSFLSILITADSMCIFTQCKANEKDILWL